MKAANSRAYEDLETRFRARFVFGMADDKDRRTRVLDLLGEAGRAFASKAGLLIQL